MTTLEQVIARTKQTAGSTPSELRKQAKTLEKKSGLDRKKLAIFLQAIGVVDSPEEGKDFAQSGDLEFLNSISWPLGDAGEGKHYIKRITTKLGAPTIINSNDGTQKFHVWQIRGKGDVYIEIYKKRSSSLFITSKAPA